MLWALGAGLLALDQPVSLQEPVTGFEILRDVCFWLCEYCESCERCQEVAEDE